MAAWLSVASHLEERREMKALGIVYDYRDRDAENEHSVL
jgi:hypothetical protein